jgi:hypothetical protein
MGIGLLVVAAIVAGREGETDIFYPLNLKTGAWCRLRARLAVNKVFPGNLILTSPAITGGTTVCATKRGISTVSLCRV